MTQKDIITIPKKCSTENGWESKLNRIDMITDDPRYKIDESRKVYVYKNLHRNCYSVKQDGLVKMHTDEIYLWDASFRVGAKGRERVLKEKRKNVHAGVSGYVDKAWTHENHPCTNCVIYNPYKWSTFIYGAKNIGRGDPIPVFHSPKVRLSHVDGKARIDAVPINEERKNKND